MTRVTDLSVRDFKPVEEASVEPGGVNLLVGRNNVGKTSLLEALHLALDPSSISRFDGNLDKVVRERAEVAELVGTVSGDGATEDLHVNVERPSEEEVSRQFEQAISRALDSIIELQDHTEEEIEEIREIRDEVTDSLSGIDSETLSRLLVRHSAILEVEKNRYEYLRVPRNHLSLWDFVEQRLSESVLTLDKIANKKLREIF
ncbi:AAA family ATPase [Halobaculum sp. MBLA0147]|uniref:AAA family ATPase n=1 Tax=Halobaculum sp. MBLA0147 TaxID=3079934 RepID=UPI003525AD3B